MHTDPLAGTGEPTAERRVISGATMGTRYSLVCYPPAESDMEALTRDLAAAVGRVDDQMSTWKPESDLSRLNRAGTDVWIDVPTELAQVLDTALRIGQQSQGAFDIAVGELVAAWGFGPGGVANGAERRRLGELTATPAHLALEMDVASRRVRKHAPLAMDLCGIAKGFGVDELARVAEAHGVSSYLAAIDGELRAGAAKPDGSSWVVALEKPTPGRREAEGYLTLEHGSLATSGDYRHFAEIDGRIVAHTIDPRTRQPLDNGVAAVTVRAGTCMEADAWATAMMVLGPERGEPLAATLDLEVLYSLHW